MDNNLVWLMSTAQKYVREQFSSGSRILSVKVIEPLLVE